MRFQLQNIKLYSKEGVEMQASSWHNIKKAISEDRETEAHSDKNSAYKCSQNANLSNGANSSFNTG